MPRRNISFTSSRSPGETHLRSNLRRADCRCPMCATPDSANRRSQGGQILRIERAQRRFHGCSNSKDSFFHTSPEKGDPKAAADRQSRPPHRGGTARMRCIVELHLFRCHRARCLGASSFHLALRTNVISKMVGSEVVWSSTRFSTRQPTPRANY